MKKVKKKKVSKKKAPKDIKEIIGRFYFCICVVIFAYAIIGVPILTHILKKYGTKTEAVITSKTSTWLHRWTTSCYMYEFYVGDKAYDGNSINKSDSLQGGYHSSYFLSFLLWVEANTDTNKKRNKH